MAAEVKYAGGPQIQRDSGPMRGEAVMWVRVGNSGQLRAIRLTTDQLVHLAYKCLEILNERRGK